MVKTRKEFKKAGLILLALVLGAGIFYAGFRAGLTGGKAAVGTGENQITNSNLSLFWDVLKIIKAKHIDASKVSNQDFLYGAIKGAVGALNDPYSVFFKPADAKKFEEDLSGSFGGIGAEIGVQKNQLVVIAPLKGNPAEAVGLKAGDKILKIDETVTFDLSVDEAVKIIRGEPGTEVKLLIFRDGWKEAKEYPIKRKIIVVPTLDWEMKPGKIAYIALHNFNANAPSTFYQAALSASLQGTKGVILDLRDNPGGFLDAAVNLGGWFFDRGDVVVLEKFGSGESQKLLANGSGALKKLPVVVLINGGSASASEILAGALRDNRGAKLVGEKSFGKGTVQEIENLSDGSTLKVSIAEWLTPKGSQINKKGLLPDFEVKITDEDAKNKKDPQLEKAIEILKSQINP